VTSLLAHYPVRLVVPVAWGEMDAMRHVNNIVYFRWFESVRIAYFERVALPGFVDQSRVSAILASTGCRYKAPVEYPDTVEVGGGVSALEEHGFVMRYAVWSRKLERIAAEGEGRVVAYDYAARRKVGLPPELRQRIVELEAAAGNRLGDDEVQGS
jgi:acyl-CoA thioester hydrolase